MRHHEVAIRIASFVSLFVALFILIALLAHPSEARAGNGPSQAVYDSPPKAIITAVAKPSSDDGGSLPFTGVDLGVALAGGIALIGLGVSINYLGTRNYPTQGQKGRWRS